MRKRRVYLLLIGVVLLAGVLVAVFSREREPEYGGKRLSEWVEGYGDAPPFQVNADADAALRHFGTNAVPYLLKWIRYEPPAWKTKLSGELERINRAWQIPDPKEDRADGAMYAFVALGAQAEIAIGELTKVLNDPKARESAARAAFDLGKLGRAGLPPLLAILTNQHSIPEVRVSVAVAVVMGKNAQFAVPALQQLLTDPDRWMRNAATNTLHKIHLQALERGTR